MDRERRRGLIAMGVLAVAGAVALGLASCFVWWFIVTLMPRGA